MKIFPICEASTVQIPAPFKVRVKLEMEQTSSVLLINEIGKPEVLVAVSGRDSWFMEMVSGSKKFITFVPKNLTSIITFLAGRKLIDPGWLSTKLQIPGVPVDLNNLILTEQIVGERLMIETANFEVAEYEILTFLSVIDTSRGEEWEITCIVLVLCHFNFPLTLRQITEPDLSPAFIQGAPTIGATARA